MIEVIGTDEGVKATIKANSRELAEFMATLTKHVVKTISADDLVDALLVSAAINRAILDGLDAAMKEASEKGWRKPS